MAKLKLTFAAGGYDIVLPLADGTVTAEGIDLEVRTDMESAERHLHLARGHEFDICEFNVAAYFVACDQDHPYTALPVFLHRRFRHGFVFVPGDGSIRQPKDLIGKRVAGPNFIPAGNVWIRGILEEYYGVPHRDIVWMTQREEDIPFEHAPGLRIERLKSSKPLDELLFAGEIDAIIHPSVPKAFADGDPRIVRLFPDNKSVEIAYFKHTGLFPIMHITTIRRDIVEKHPWVPASLARAFEQAKRLAYRRVENPRMVPLAFVRSAVEEQQSILGRDPWEYGLTATNRRNLETIQRYTHQQGMTRRLRPLDEIVLDTYPAGAAEGASGV